MDVIKVLGEHGWPAAFFAALVASVYAVARWLAPHIEAICSAKVAHINTMSKAVDEAAKQQKRQTRLWREHTLILREHTAILETIQQALTQWLSRCVTPEEDGEDDDE